jgi:hypothetical protein
VTAAHVSHCYGQRHIRLECSRLNPGVSCDPERVLRELRGRHGGPHLGTRLLALVLVLLLAAPLTVWVWRLLVTVSHHLL